MQQTITYNGKVYTVGNYYTVEFLGSKYKAKLEFGLYLDGEDYYDEYHFGYILTFTYENRDGTEMVDNRMTLPDAFGLDDGYKTSACQ